MNDIRYGGNVKRLIAAMFFATVPVAAQAEPIIECTRADGSPITIELNAKSKFGKSLNCISADYRDIPSEGESCAPSNGYGMAAPTGAGVLIGVVYRWQDYMRHTGPIYGSFVSNVVLSFNGGFMSGSLKDEWKFEVSRTNGIGILTVRKPDGYYKETGRYSCKGVSRKF